MKNFFLYPSGFIKDIKQQQAIPAMKIKLGIDCLTLSIILPATVIFTDLAFFNWSGYNLNSAH